MFWLIISAELFSIEGEEVEGPSEDEDEDEDVVVGFMEGITKSRRELVR
jgi:hypothetical protein